MPAVKSRKRLPSTSVTQRPWPWSITNGYARVKLGAIARVSRAMSSAALGPGRGVWIDGRRSAAMRADNISVVRLTERQVRILNGLNTSGVPANEHIEKLARKYTGRKFKGFRPDQRRGIVKATPPRVHAPGSPPRWPSRPQPPAFA